MRRVLIRISVLTACTLAAQGAGAGQQSYKVLYSFSCPACTYGVGPTGLIEDGRGGFFGTTYNGGKFGKGQVFELSQTGKDKYSFRDIYDFCSVGARYLCRDGENPLPLVRDIRGNLYGVTFIGGEAFGNAYELSPAGNGWQLRSLYSFCAGPRHDCTEDGDFPYSGLTYVGAATGKLYDGVSPLYGVTHGDGSQNMGNVFELQPGSPMWHETVLHQFCPQGNCSDGAFPNSTLVVDNAGNLYGSMIYGYGAVYKLSPSGGSWTYSIPYSFCSQQNCADGEWPTSALAVDSSGSVYGGTQLGGYACSHQSNGCGVVFQLSSGGTQESVLHTFCETDCSDGYIPLGSTLFNGSPDMLGTADAGGNFTNIAAGGGTAFEIRNGQYHLLHKFCGQPGCTDGESPIFLMRSPSGHLFGETSAGGANGKGVIFEIGG